MSIGKITRTELKKVWPHEAHDFTKWLADNIDVLNEVIDTNVTVVEREKAAGDFRLDLLAETENGRSAVIENQFGRSDHDHLGKLVTYQAAFDAEVAIWIVEQPRAEHVSAVSWLNSSCADAVFYLIKAESISIGNSEPALLLTKIVGPGEESKVIANEKKQLTERHHIRREFWVALLERMQGKTTLHANLSPTFDNWLSTSTGINGIGLNYVIGKDWWRVEIYVSRGKESKEENERIFDLLTDQRETIEDSFDLPIDWERLDAKQSCRIAYTKRSEGYRSPKEQWPAIHENMINTMARFDAAIRKPLQATMQHESITVQSANS